MTASAQGISNLDHDSELVRQGEQTSAVPIEQPALAHRQLVQTAARARFVALCGFDPASRRTCGHIEFVDERATYDAVPDEMKRRLDRLVAEQSIFNSRARLAFTNFSDEERQQMPAVPQVLVRTIPEPGRKSLYLAPDAGRIFGMPDQEGRALIDQLMVHATQRQFVYTHRWRVNDLVMWDDRCTMHRGTDFDDLRGKRDVQRTTVFDVANSCEQEEIETAA